jgi:hypothetical protein
MARSPTPGANHGGGSEQGRGPNFFEHHDDVYDGDMEKRLIVDIWYGMHAPKPSQTEIRQFFPFFKNLLTNVLQPNEPYVISPANIGEVNHRIIQSLTCYRVGLPPDSVGRKLLTHLLGEQAALLDLIRGDHGSVTDIYATIELVRSTS